MTLEFVRSDKSCEKALNWHFLIAVVWEIRTLKIKSTQILMINTPALYTLNHKKGKLTENFQLERCFPKVISFCYFRICLRRDKMTTHTDTFVIG